ncbi:9272_t:CDS:2 [Entrophospora sp. SA101]|nr:9272_t:CDS:2 [Entrophospora sp. SA101]
MEAENNYDLTIDNGEETSSNSNNNIQSSSSNNQRSKIFASNTPDEPGN